MAVKRNYRINLRNYGNPPAIMVSQYDENYDLVFEVYDGVVPSTGLNVYTVKLVGRQPGNDPALKYEFMGTVSGIANNILSFTIDTTMTGRAGKGTAEIVILDTTNDVKFASFNLPVYVEKAAVPDDAIDADVERAQEIAEQVEELIDGATEGAEAWAVGQRNGTDVPATDPTYHNNAKYYAEQAQDIADSIGIDATLSISGKAADAKKTGDEISSLKEDLNSADEQLAMLISKTLVPPTEITQVADLTGAKQSSNSGGYYYYNTKVNVPWIGTYYMNPSNLNLYCFYFRAYNKKGEQLTIYRNGSSISSFKSVKGGYFVKTDARTIKTYTASGSLDWTWTFSDDIEYFYDPSLYNGNIGNFEDSSQLVGVTYYGASETYVPYVNPSDAEYTYEYADDMISGVHSGLAESYVDAEPKENSDNFVKSGGVITYAFKDTYNLVDPNWYKWDEPSYVNFPTGFYVPVTEGKYLLCNCAKVGYTFYDENNAQVGSQQSTAITFAPVLVPTGAVKMRMYLNKSDYIPEDHKVLVYYSDNTVSPKDDVRVYVPHKNLIGERGSNDIFDHYYPNALDTEILQMAKYSAVRNMNFCNNTIRIGTFNMYLARTTYGWKTAKRMFKDYAVDMVGFQEVSDNNQRVWTEFLKSWQFTNGHTDAPVAIASHFPILSHDVYTTTVTERKYMRTIIQLPRYADAITPTLSLYTYHGIWNGGTPAIRAQEVAEILAVIAQDTSDFKVVVGDTNAESPSEWDTWINAGFTPVNDGNGTITVSDGSTLSLDNIFVPSNAICVNWHVVPSAEYPITISGSDVPLSDHDFVFADIKFDFDSLIRT